MLNHLSIVLLFASQKKRVLSLGWNNFLIITRQGNLLNWGGRFLKIARKTLFLPFSFVSEQNFLNRRRVGNNYCVTHLDNDVEIVMTEVNAALVMLILSVCCFLGKMKWIFMQWGKIHLALIISVYSKRKGRIKWIRT